MRADVQNNNSSPAIIIEQPQVNYLAPPNLMIIGVKISGHDAEALIDSGATISLNTAHRIKIHLRERVSILGLYIFKPLRNT